MPLVSRTRATLRSAEFGFFGVVVYTRVQTPRRCGEPLRAGVFAFPILSWRPLRTSCWIVGIRPANLLVSNRVERLAGCCLGGGRVVCVIRAASPVAEVGRVAPLPAGQPDEISPVRTVSHAAYGA